MNVWKDSIKELISETINKRFVVFVFATILLYTNKISPDIWLYIAVGYMAANVFEGIAQTCFPKRG